MYLQHNSTTKNSNGVFDVNVYIFGKTPDLKISVKQYTYHLPSQFAVDLFLKWYHKGKTFHGKALSILTKYHTDDRYPYTYACDYIRAIAGYNKNGTKLSRADASQIRQGIAKVLNMQDENLACALADYYQKHSEEIEDRNMKQIELIFEEEG